MLAAKQAEQIEKQEKVLALQAPKVEFADQLLKSTNAIDIGTAAKAMNLGFGRNTLFQKLRDLKILDQANRPYQRFVDEGYFTVLETSFVHPKTGDRQMTFKTLITASGQKYVLKQLKSVKSEEKRFTPAKKQLKVADVERFRHHFNESGIIR